jgi:hypothetical protein
MIGMEVILESLGSLSPMHPSRPGEFARPSLRLHVFWSHSKNPMTQPGKYLH